ncbi:MAG: alpha/beta hydrolase [Alphaproteobacteria bacterium]
MYKNYSQDELDAQYNNRQRVPEHEVIMGELFQKGKDFSFARAPHLDLPFGKHEDELLDIYLPAENNTNAPVMVYIHGGFWTSRHKDDFRFLAASWTQKGYVVVVVNYSLIPQITLAGIVDQCVRSLIWVRENILDFGGDPDKIRLVGHSAGGHLAAMLLCEPRLGDNAVEAALLISGLYDLKPIKLSYMNEILQLNEEDLSKRSPEYLVPKSVKKLMIVVGGAESDEFIDQSQSLAKTWDVLSKGWKYLVLKDLNHFTILESLENHQGSLHQEWQSYLDA